MKAATDMDEYRAEARISIQALVGRIRLHLRGQKPLELSAGQLLALDCSRMTSKHSIPAPTSSPCIAATMAGGPATNEDDIRT
jgi:hypothetical protein